MECFSEALSAHQVAGTTSVGRDTGVYVGVSQLEYARITYGAGSGLNTYYATGAHLSVASGKGYGLNAMLCSILSFILDYLCTPYCHRSSVVHLRLQGPCHDCGHRLFFLSGHHPSRLPGIARASLPGGRQWWCQSNACALLDPGLSQGRHAI